MTRIAMIAALALGLAAAATAQAQEALAKSGGCLNCHAIDGKKIGPSFKESAAKYKGQSDAEAMLLAKLADSTKHPATKASPDDRAKLIKWILSL